LAQEKKAKEHIDAKSGAKVTSNPKKKGKKSTSSQKKKTSTAKKDEL
jgi:hypothetical protein